MTGTGDLDSIRRIAIRTMAAASAAGDRLVLKGGNAESRGGADVVGRRWKEGSTTDDATASDRCAPARNITDPKDHR